MAASFAKGIEGSESTRESSSDTIAKVVSLSHKCLNRIITNEDISTAHRLSGNPNAQILIRFMRCAVRDKVYNTRYGLNVYNVARPAKEKVFINEDLSPQSHTIFSAAWKARGRDGPIESVFT